MKIYIPTLGRSDKQITFLNLPKFLQEKTHLVVQPAEKHLYDNFPITVLPEDDIGSSRTRQFIYDLAGESLWGIIDDDILMKERRPKEKPTKILMNEDGWKYFYDKKGDCHYFELREKPWGEWNEKKLKFCLGDKFNYF